MAAPRQAGIYAITSPAGKIYVGQSVDLPRRVERYRNLDCKTQTRLYRSIIKYGWSAHKFEILMPLREDISNGNLTYWEQSFMNFYRNNGFELMNLKEAGPSGKFSEESIKRRSDSRRGKPLSEEHRRKISEGNKGRIHSPEHIAKLKAAIRPPHTEKQKQLIIKSLTGRPVSEATREKIKLAHLNRHDNNGILNPTQVRIIFHSLNFGIDRDYLSKIFKVKGQVIYEIRTGKRSSHITGLPRIRKIKSK